MLGWILFMMICLILGGMVAAIVLEDSATKSKYKAGQVIKIVGDDTNRIYTVYRTYKESSGAYTIVLSWYDNKELKAKYKEVPESLILKS